MSLSRRVRSCRSSRRRCWSAAARPARAELVAADNRAHPVGEAHAPKDDKVTLRRCGSGGDLTCTARSIVRIDPGRGAVSRGAEQAPVEALQGRQAGAASDAGPYADVIKAAASRHGLDPSLVHALIRAESTISPARAPRAGLAGLMQLMPATAARLPGAQRLRPGRQRRGRRPPPSDVARSLPARPGARRLQRRRRRGRPVRRRPAVSRDTCLRDSDPDDARRQRRRER